MKRLNAVVLLLAVMTGMLFAEPDLYGYSIISDGKVILYEKTRQFTSFGGAGAMTTSTKRSYRLRDQRGNVVRFKVKTLSQILADNPESMRLLKKQKQRYITMVCVAPLIIPLFFYQFVVPNPKSYMIEAVRVYNR